MESIVGIVTSAFRTFNCKQRVGLVVVSHVAPRALKDNTFMIDDKDKCRGRLASISKLKISFYPVHVDSTRQ